MFVLEKQQKMCSVRRCWQPRDSQRLSYRLATIRWSNQHSDETRCNIEHFQELFFFSKPVAEKSVLWWASVVGKIAALLKLHAERRLGCGSEIFKF